MMKKWAWLPLAIFLVLVLFLWRGLSLNPQLLPSTQIGKPLPKIVLPLLYHEHTNIDLQRLHGRYYLLTIWASWCEACVEEQPFLLQLARQGISIIGINYKDKPAQAKAWLREWGNPYQSIAADRKGMAAVDLGVYGAPETFLINPQGVIILRHVGILDQQTWNRDFLPRMHHD